MWWVSLYKKTIINILFHISMQYGMHMIEILGLNIRIPFYAAKR